MGALAGTVSDGNFLFTSEDITITTTGSSPTTITYFSRSIRLTDAATVIEGKNSAGVTVRQGFIKPGVYTGTADLMYPSTGTPVVPASLTPFTMTIPEFNGGAALNCIITNSQPTRSNDSEAVCSIEFRTVINTLTVGT